MSGALQRSAALLGEYAMRRLAGSRVLVVGVGGVGSWCAEALVRTGLGTIVLMDDDTVAESNLNRQCPATLSTLGRPKVEAMAERLRSIRDDVEVTALKLRFMNWSDLAGLGDFDFIVDAIDSVDCKAELILGATAAKVPVICSMGAALRLDPTRVRITRFEKVSGDGLARALRQRFKRLSRFPSARFDCVWSDEIPHASPANSSASSLSPEPASSPAHLPERGSIMTVTASFGLALASRVIANLSS